MISPPKPLLSFILGLILSLCSGFASAIIPRGIDTSLNGLSATAPVAMNAEGEAQSTTHSANDIRLSATNQIDLQAAQNTNNQQSNNRNQSASIGLGFGLGQGGAGASLTLSASQGKGSSGGNDLTWTHTQISAGNSLDLTSGGDTTLQGAVASAEQITAAIGGNLNLQSLQDQSSYSSREQNLGGSLSVPLTPGAGFGASLNAGRTRIDSTYASVTQQTGLKAGDQGFQIDVGGNTDLQGAVIASSDAAVQNDRNRLTTATLTTRDIENKAEYQANSTSLGLGYSSGGQGVGTNGQGQTATGAAQTPNSTLASLNGLSATAPVAMKAEGEAKSTTQSAISGGQIDITDEAAQQQKTGQTAEQTLASLQRDTGNAQNSLTPIFNEQEIRAGFEIVGAFSRESGTFLSHRAQESAAAQQAIDREMEKPEGQRDPSVIHQATQTLQKNALWAPGGSGRVLLTAVTAAAAGNVTGSGAEFLQAATVHTLQSLGAQQLKQLADQLGGEGSPAHTALHAVLGCAGAAASGGSCGTGALAASSGVVLNTLLDGLEGKESANLNAEEREARANLLTTLVTGITTAAGGEAAVANTAARIETENNALFLIPIALELIDKGLTAYDAWQLDKAIKEGRLDEAKEIAAGIAIGLATEAVPGDKILQKIGEALGKTGKVGEEVVQGAAEVVSKQSTKELLPKITTSNDGFATWIKVVDDPRAVVRIEKNENSFYVTDINKGSLPGGSGSDLLATGLRTTGVKSGDKVAFTGIINQETLSAYQSGIAAADSLLGKTGRNAIAKLGMEVSKVEFQLVRGKLSLVIEIK